ncbi:BON domain-containing protein [Alkalilimnicola sp. S0819]|uniref:BON domain-containing protein n=1 Tax=Alkalilimnicola sp. S0819 TaxID=2613922 RepID=UPI0012629EDA|nr:BON domain-containing protein [Alkalilimnicola sp. S0819]KAB7623843.1 BON domain-containing protein [Alkalilimnicola sp. S0819]MPQ16719.1 BON domain-containing protein [Alkalilimnicola sp. S0819]
MSLASKTGLLCLALLGSALLSGCAAVAVGGAATTAAAAHDRRTMGTFLDDQLIEAKAMTALFEDQRQHGANISITSYNLHVLISGEVPNRELKSKAGRVVADIPRVERVYNELRIAGRSSFMARRSDSLITARVKTRLLSLSKLPKFDPSRVKVVTEAGTVYLMGLLTREEGDQVAEVVRQVGGVQRVVKLFEYLETEQAG